MARDRLLVRSWGFPRCVARASTAPRAAGTTSALVAVADECDPEGHPPRRPTLTPAYRARNRDRPRRQARVRGSTSRTPARSSLPHQPSPPSSRSQFYRNRVNGSRPGTSGGKKEPGFRPAPDLHALAPKAPNVLSGRELSGAAAERHSVSDIRIGRILIG